MVGDIEYKKPFFKRLFCDTLNDSPIGEFFYMKNKVF